MNYRTGNSLAAILFAFLLRSLPATALRGSSAGRELSLPEEEFDARGRELVVGDDDDDNCAAYILDHSLLPEASGGYKDEIPVLIDQFGQNAYWGVTFNAPNLYSSAPLQGWSGSIELTDIDTTKSFTADVWSSYSHPTFPTEAVDKETLLYQVNWLINNYAVGVYCFPCGAYIGFKEFQLAIWLLIDDGPHTHPNIYGVNSCVANELYTQASAISSYTPNCGDPDERLVVVLIFDNKRGRVKYSTILVDYLLSDTNICECQPGSASPTYLAAPTPPPVPAPTPPPTPDPTPYPTPDPTPYPTPDPTPYPTPGPTPDPTPGPTPVPTPDPTPGPTPDPTPGPTPYPTPDPTPGPTPVPTPSPTPGPTAASAPTPGAQGDPHFKTWSGDKYDFHGACDLVLLKNPTFRSGLGLDIHIRSKRTKYWSYIDSVVVRIGDETLEVSGCKDYNSDFYWLNRSAGADLNHGLAGFKVNYHMKTSRQHMFKIELGNNARINIKNFKEMVRVDVDAGDGVDFGSSMGLMGSFGEGRWLARDGSTVLGDPVSLGMEWQVQANEPMLFMKVEGAQAPQKCVMPSQLVLRRRLEVVGMTTEDAEEACARVNADDRDNCIFDVLATNDKDVAGAY